MRATRLTDVVTDHGEGAGWHPAEGVFKVVDMLAGDLLTLSPDGPADRLHLGPVAAAWRPRAAGGTVVAVERGFALLSAAGEVEWSVDAWADPSIRMNEGACDPQGRFYCGSMAYDAAPCVGVLWRLDPDRTVHRVLDGLTIPNGLVWSEDGTTVFHIDTPRGRIDAWEFDDGSFHDRRTLVDVSCGGPDGMCADAEGGLWVALWGGGAVHRFDQHGELTDVIEVGASQVTSCAFGGPGLDQLLITTSRWGLAEGAEPNAGAVFSAEPGVRGVPLREFGG